MARFINLGFQAAPVRIGFKALSSISEHGTGSKNKTVSKII
jgi:hypothetical protein